MVIENSPTLSRYKDIMKQSVRLYYPYINEQDLDKAIEYSIEKRLKNTKATLNNSYTHKEKDLDLLRLIDYINSREPIVTAFGTLFKKHADCINPLYETIQSFLDLRSMHKKEMFKYPKGSEDFEKYNLLQLLDKIDANG